VNVDTSEPPKHQLSLQLFWLTLQVQKVGRAPIPSCCPVSYYESFPSSLKHRLFGISTKCADKLSVLLRGGSCWSLIPT
jgi:hypothetical protein